MVAFVALFSRGKPGVLPHGPQFAPVHVSLNAASKWKCSRFRVAGFWFIFLRVDFFYFNSGISEKFSFFGHRNFQIDNW